MNIDMKWLWSAMVGGSILLAVPGNTEFSRILGDTVGHLFSAGLLAVVPIIGYRLMYKQINEKEITYIFGAAWFYLVISQFFWS